MVGDAGVETLSIDHPDLIELNLWHTKVTGQSVATITKFKGLQKLGVVNTPLADQDYEAFKQLGLSLPKCEIVALD